MLIGVSTQPKAFTKDIVEEMARHVGSPNIFPLSNPTKLHEAEPRDLIEWTNGNVMTATGSPFAPVEWNGRKHVIAECNNSTIFPGIGLGAVLSRPKLMTPELLVAATKALASQVPVRVHGDRDAGLLPDITGVREVSAQIAAAVIRQAIKDGIAQVEIPSNAGLEDWVRESMWDATYRPLRKVLSECG